MIGRRLLGLVAVVAVLALLAPSAFAGCNPPKSFSTWNALEGRYTYIYFGDASGNPDNLVGSFWQTDNPATNNQTYPVQEWLLDNYYFPMQDSWYLNGNLGDARPDCPAGGMTVEASNTVTGGWFVTAADETPGGFITFDFSVYPSIDTRGVSAQPRINSSSRAADLVTLNVTVEPGVVGGLATIDETRIYQFGPTATAPTTRSPADWTQIGTIAGNGGSTDVSVDCTGFAPGDQAFVGTSYVSGGNPGQVAGILSQVECDPNLADPVDRFRLIDRDSLKKGKGAKRNR